MKIKISQIGLPAHYVRGKTSAANIKDLLDVVLKTNGETAPEKLIGKKLNWPFHSPIIVAKNPEPKIGKSLGGDDKVKIKQWRPYEIIDGFHRLKIWQKLKQKEIEAVVKDDIVNPFDRFLMQYQTNSSHGLRLDKDARDEAIRKAYKEFKIPITKLSKAFGMHTSSIDRIIKFRQRIDRPRKKPAERKLDEASNLPTEMNAQDFLGRLGLLCNTFPHIQNDVGKLAHSIGPSRLGSIVATLKRLIVALQQPLTEKRSPTNGGQSE